MNIEHIFIITLPHRLDRISSIKKQLDELSLSYEVFNGVNGRFIKTSYISDNMNVGCTASHGQVIQRAKIYGLNNCLILEDDCELSPEFLETINNLELPSDFDLCYLSGTHRKEPIFVNETISKCINTLTTHAYIVNLNSENISKLQSQLLNESYTQPVDCYFSDMQQTGNFYVLNKPIAWQKAGYSDIVGRVMCYAWLKDNL